MKIVDRITMRELLERVAELAEARQRGSYRRANLAAMKLKRDDRPVKRGPDNGSAEQMRSYDDFA